MAISPMISIWDGTSPWPTISATARPVFSRSSKKATHAALPLGLGTIFITISVTIPRVPSEPQKNFSNWNPPELTGVLVPTSITSPVGSTTVKPRT